MIDLTPSEAGILSHTSDGAAGGLFCGDSEEMQRLVSLGLMVFAGKKSFVRDPYFKMTAKGREALGAWRAAQPPPKRTHRKRRSAAFDAWMGCSDLFTSFSEFYKHWKARAY